MKNLISFLLILFTTLSCSTRRSSPPSWVSFLREGAQTHKIVSGNRVFYRRLVKIEGISKNDACDEAISKAESDIKTEYGTTLSIPYTLEVLYIDEDYKDCAVTISISSLFETKLKEMKVMKEAEDKALKDLESKWTASIKEKEIIKKKYDELQKFVNENGNLFSKYEKLSSRIDQAVSSLKSRRNRSIASAYRGLSVEEFRSIYGEKVALVFDVYSKCHDVFETNYISTHGNVSICWRSRDGRVAFIAGYCDISKNECYYKDA